MPRVRQAVLAASDLAGVCEVLRGELGLGEPFSDPGVGYFGLENAVFALGDTFLEVVSPVREGTAVGRRLERLGGDCGYMVMCQVADLAGARERARRLGIREVFAVELDDMSEVHLHPADIGGAIVSLSAPVPRQSWRWAGPDWEQRSAALRLAGVRIGARDPERLAARWQQVLGDLPTAGQGRPAVRFVEDPEDRGLVEIEIEGGEPRSPLAIGGLWLVFDL
jgi:hypothetical protein